MRVRAQAAPLKAAGAGHKVDLQNYQGPLASGLSRRAFLRTSAAVALLAAFSLHKPVIAAPAEKAKSPPSDAPFRFSEPQRQLLSAVLLHLFPDDGNGPSARDIQALSYLEWAMEDESNQADGDPEFIQKGVGWLNEDSLQHQGGSFLALTHAQQAAVLEGFAQQQYGENWLALLLYYLTEALLLDPIYGGNPNQIGWRWLEHQPGYPRPEKGSTYRDYLKV